VTVFADLSTTSNQGMRIYHRSVGDVRTDIDVHRRHTGDSPAYEGTVADTRATGYDPNPGLGVNLFQRVRRFIKKRQTATVCHINDPTHTEAKENSLLHPAIDAPTRHLRGIWLGRPNSSSV
jgi:hypothetical protein